MAGIVSLDGLNLNDGVNYFVMANGINLGERQTTWEEVPSYAGVSSVQVNVQRGALIPVTLPMMVKGSSLNDLKVKLDELWAKVESTTSVTLVVDSESFTIVHSTRPDTVERNQQYELGYIAQFTLVLTREPEL